MNLRRPALLLGLGLVAAFGAACGDEDNGDDETTAAATTAAATTTEAATTAAETTATTAETAAGEGETTDDVATTQEPLDATTADTAADTAVDTGTDTAAADVSPEQAAFIEEADAICQAAEDEIEAMGEPQSEEQLPEFLEQAVTVQEEQIEKLKELEAPAGDEAFWTEVLGLLDQVHAVSVELRDAAAAGGGEAELQPILDRGTPLQDQLTQLADEYGFQSCGE